MTTTTTRTFEIKVVPSAVDDDRSYVSVVVDGHLRDELFMTPADVAAFAEAWSAAAVGRANDTPIRNPSSKCPRSRGASQGSLYRTVVDGELGMGHSTLIPR